MVNTGLIVPNPPPVVALVMSPETPGTGAAEGLADFLRASGLVVWEVDSELAFYKALLLREADMVLVDEGLPGDAARALVTYLAAVGRHRLLVLTEGDTGMSAFRAIGAHWCVDRGRAFRDILYGIVMLWEAQNQSAAMPEGWMLDPEQPELIAPDGRSVSLTASEMRLLGALMACHGQTLSKIELVNLLWGGGADRDYHGVEVLLSRLRRKVMKKLGLPLPVQAVQAVGLLFHGRVRPNVP